MDLERILVGMVPGPPKDLVIWDIDGVLCDSSARARRYIDPSARERGDAKALMACYNAFGMTTAGDVAISTGVAFFRALHALLPTLTPVYVTARDENSRSPTSTWLRRHLSCDDGAYLLMQPVASRETVLLPRDVEYKREAVRALRAGGHLIRLAFDDHPGNVAMYQEEGIPAFCVQVAGVDCLTPVGARPVVNPESVDTGIPGFEPYAPPAQVATC